MSKVLVTGASGFIGSHVVDMLIAEGHDVTCSVHSSLPKQECKLVFNTTELKESLAKQDIIYYLAGVLGHPGIPYWIYEDAHVNFPARILSYINSYQLFVYMSSCWIHYPKKPYEVTKLEGEAVVKRSRVKHKIIRPGFVFGERDRHLLPLFRAINKHGRLFPIVGSGDNLVCPTYVKDVSRAVIDIDEESKEITQAAGKPIAMKEFIYLIAKLLGKSKPTLHIPAVKRGIIGKLTKSDFLATERVFKSDVECTELEFGLKKTIEWYKGTGWL